MDCLVKTINTNLDWAFRKSCAVKMSKSTTTCKLVDYLVNIHLTHLFPMHPFSTPTKSHVFSVFSEYRKSALGANRLMLFKKKSCCN